MPSIFSAGVWRGSDFRRILKNSSRISHLSNKSTTSSHDIEASQIKSTIRAWGAAGSISRKAYCKDLWGRWNSSWNGICIFLSKKGNSRTVIYSSIITNTNRCSSLIWHPTPRIIHPPSSIWHYLRAKWRGEKSLRIPCVKLRPEERFLPPLMTLEHGAFHPFQAFEVKGTIQGGGGMEKSRIRPVGSAKSDCSCHEMNHYEWESRYIHWCGRISSIVIAAFRWNEATIDPLFISQDNASRNPEVRYWGICGESEIPLVVSSREASDVAQNQGRQRRCAVLTIVEHARFQQGIPARTIVNPMILPGFIGMDMDRWRLIALHFLLVSQRGSLSRLAF